MSNITCNDNGVTSSQNPVGLLVIQIDDFYQRASLLQRVYPLAVGTIAIVVLFVYLRLSSNRCVAPVTLFDWILNVALGSTLAGIVNGTSLARGMLSLTVILSFQLIASQISSHYGPVFERALNAPPLLIAFRGRPLTKVMRKHRISQSDLYGSLRAEKIWNLQQVEAVIIEPNGAFSVYRRANCPTDMDAEVLLDVPAYRRLVEDFEAEGVNEKGQKGEWKSDGTKRQRSGSEGETSSSQEGGDDQERRANEVAEEES